MPFSYSSVTGTWNQFSTTISNDYSLNADLDGTIVN
jgi:hypothetical protein